VATHAGGLSCAPLRPLGWVVGAPPNEMGGRMEIIFAFFALIRGVALITVLIAAVVEAMDA
jgi:hypothetical protein